MTDTDHTESPPSGSDQGSSAPEPAQQKSHGEIARESLKPFFEQLARALPREKVVGGLRVLRQGLFLDEKLLDEVVSQFRGWSKERSPTGHDLAQHKALRRLFETETPALHYLLDGKVCLVGHLVPCPIDNLSKYKIPVFQGSLHNPHDYLHPRDPLLQTVPGLEPRLDAQGFGLLVTTPQGKLLMSETALKEFSRVYEHSSLLQKDFGPHGTTLRQLLKPLVGMLSKSRPVKARSTGLMPLLAWRAQHPPQQRPQHQGGGRPGNRDQRSGRDSRQDNSRRGDGRHGNSGRGDNRRGGGPSDRRGPGGPGHRGRPGEGRPGESRQPQQQFARPDVPPAPRPLSFRRYRMLTLLVDESPEQPFPRVVACFELQGRNMDEWLLSEVQALKNQSQGRPLGAFRFAQNPQRHSIGTVQAGSDSLQISLRLLRNTALKGPAALAGTKTRDAYTVRHCLEALGKLLAQSSWIELHQLEHNIPREKKVEFQDQKEVRFRSAPGWVFVVRGRGNVESAFAKLRQIAPAPGARERQGPRGESRRARGGRRHGKPPASGERGASGGPPQENRPPGEGRNQRRRGRRHRGGRGRGGERNQQSATAPHAAPPSETATSRKPADESGGNTE